MAQGMHTGEHDADGPGRGTPDPDGLSGRPTGRSAGRHDGDSVVDGRYTLLRELGRGGMGVVWEAWDSRLDRHVAVKGLLFPTDTDAQSRAALVERARREAMAIARIGHEHVVAVHDVTEAHGQVWIVMELVSPGSLAELLREHGRLPVTETATTGLQVLRGLRAAHAAGVMHRDVKPHNILFRREGYAVLMDFGIAALEGSSQVTRIGEILGTPRYLAPELAVPWSPERLVATPASDLWSLGVTLYEAVEGRAPFRGADSFEILGDVRASKPAQPQHAGALGPVLEGLLQKDPAHRMSAERAEELLAEIAQEQTGGGLPTHAPVAVPSPVPAPVGAGAAADTVGPGRSGTVPVRTSRMRRGLLPAALTAGLLGLAGAGLFVWGGDEEGQGSAASPAASSAAPEDDKPADKPSGPAADGRPVLPSGGPNGRHPALPQKQVVIQPQRDRPGILLRNTVTGACADLDGVGGGTEGRARKVTQSACVNTPADNQRWNMKVPYARGGLSGQDLVMFHNAKNQRFCLSVPGTAPQPEGSLVMEANCNNTLKANHLWWIEPRDEGGVLIHNYVSDHHCLSVDGDARAQGARLVIANCGATGTARWNLAG